MNPTRRSSFRDHLEALAGMFGALFLSIGIAGAAGRLVPGSWAMHDIAEICALGLALLFSSFFVFRNRTLLIGRCAQALLFTAFFLVLFLLPAIVKRPGDVLAWLIIFGSIGLGYQMYRVLAQTRKHFDSNRL